MSKIISQNRKIDFSLSRIEELFFQELRNKDSLSKDSLAQAQEAQDASLISAENSFEDQLDTNSEKLLVEIRQKSQQIVQDAKNEAEQILKNTQSSVQECRKEAYEEGYKEGKQKAEEETRQRLDQEFEKEMNQIRGIIETFKESYIAVIKQAEMRLVKLVLEISRKIIRQEIVSDEKIILDMVKAALARVIERSKVIVRVHPDELGFVEENKKKILSSVLQIQDFQLQLDPAIEIGGCVIETESGSVDARIDKQFQEIAKALTGEEKMCNV